MVLCPKCSYQIKRHKIEAGINRIASLQFITKVGNTALWHCDSCYSFFFKRYSKYHTEE